MKKLALSLCLMLAFCSGLYAQNTFAPLGAEWWYNGNNWNYTYAPPNGIVNQTWTDHVVVTKDTVIQGISCRKAVATERMRSGLKPDSTFDAGTKTMYFYDNTDTVFYFNPARNSFDPLYILNATEGDTICLRNPYYPGSGPGADSLFCFTIDSVRMAVYDTTHLKTFYTRTLFDKTDHFSVNWGEGRYSGDAQRWINKGQYTEKLGGTYGKTGGFFPVVSFHNPDGGLDIAFPSGFLNCYSDATTQIKRGATPCDNLSPPFSSIVSLPLSSLGITVYPNPGRGLLTFKSERPFEKNTQLAVFDISGRLLRTETLPQGKNEARLLLTDLGGGIYYLSLSTAQGKYYQKIILQP